MALEALVVSQDSRVVRMLKMLLAELAVKVEHSTEDSQAAELVARRKFDAVFVDFALERAAELLSSVRSSPAAKRSLSFAILGEAMTLGSAFDLGANFVMYKPLTVERTKRSLRAAHGLMMRERRKHFRHAMPSSVFVDLVNEGVRAEIEDISAGGMAIRTVQYHRPELKRNLHLRFTLPGMDECVDAHGQVTWADRYGRAGVQFVAFADDSLERLQRWCTQSAATHKREDSAEAKSKGKSAAAASPQRTETVESHDIRLRAHPRGRYRGLVVVTVTIRSGNAVVIRGRCEDLSESGVGADLHGELLVGDPVLIELSLPKVSERLKLHAVVRHRRDFHYGFEFVAPSTEDRRIISRLTENLPVSE
jgi:CheY-like chemotaxis protein